MKERPIIFRGQMVRAILDGAKTQTRRIVKCKDLDYGGCGGKGSPEWDDPAMWGYEHENGEWSMLRSVAKEDYQIPCPYGVPGDRLWVRESFRIFKERHEPNNHGLLIYRADDTAVEIDGSEIDMGRMKLGKSYPSIHMPRWASRITLEITGVRVERLNEISESDAHAEGGGYIDVDGIHHHAGGHPSYSIGTFRDLWNAINGPGSWDANPFVWVIEFKLVTP